MRIKEVLELLERIDYPTRVKRFSVTSAHNVANVLVNYGGIPKLISWRLITPPGEKFEIVIGWVGGN